MIRSAKPSRRRARSSFSRISSARGHTKGTAILSHAVKPRAGVPKSASAEYEMQVFMGSMPGEHPKDGHCGILQLSYSRAGAAGLFLGPVSLHMEVWPAMHDV
jgi:hypothetical protein